MRIINETQEKYSLITCPKIDVIQWCGSGLLRGPQYCILDFVRNTFLQPSILDANTHFPDFLLLKAETVRKVALTGFYENSACKDKTKQKKLIGYTS